MISTDPLGARPVLSLIWRFFSWATRKIMTM